MQDFANKNYMLDQECDKFIESGDLHALEIIYNHYFDLLFNYGRKFYSETQLIEDAIQNVFINFIKARKNLSRIGNLRAYLISSFRNELFQLIAKNRKVHLYKSFSEAFFTPEDNHEDKVVKNESNSHLKKVLSRSLKKLTFSQREILYMKYNAGLSYEEISSTLNISIESSRTAIYRAVKTIKNDFEEMKQNGIKIFFLLFH